MGHVKMEVPVTWMIPKAPDILVIVPIHITANTTATQVYTYFKKITVCKYCHNKKRLMQLQPQNIFAAQAQCREVANQLLNKKSPKTKTQVVGM